MKKLSALLTAGLFLTNSLFANPGTDDEENIPMINPLTIIGIGTEIYEINGGKYNVMILMCDTDNNGIEDSKFTYLYIPYDKARVSTELIEYAFDWNKNRTYQISEKIEKKFLKKLKEDLNNQ